MTGSPKICNTKRITSEDNLNGRPKERKCASDLERGHIYARSCYKMEPLKQRHKKLRNRTFNSRKPDQPLTNSNKILANYTPRNGGNKKVLLILLKKKENNCFAQQTEFQEPAKPKLGKRDSQIWIGIAFVDRLKIPAFSFFRTLHRSTILLNCAFSETEREHLEMG